ncbi:MAG: DegV family EDD domain-containing protein [Lachnospiraceae bacterium]|nr:DegV family EDD domain-containing protein [Lachnospiraceae bacterium]
MSSIIIMAETGSDVNQEMAVKHGVYIVPMHVNFGEVTYDDGSFPVEDIVKYYQESGNLPKTSGSVPEDFRKAFDDIHEKWPEAHIIYLAYSAITTCSCQSAVIASAGRDYVTIIDTKMVSAGQAAVVTGVADYCKNHPQATVEEVVEIAEDYIARARMCFVPDNLEFLRAGGRVSNVAFLGSRILNIHPCIELLDGKLVATKKYRGKMTKVAANLIKDYAGEYQLDKNTLWFVHTVGLEEEVKAVAEETAKACGFHEIRWILAGGVITTHGGPAAFGLAGFASK